MVDPTLLAVLRHGGLGSADELSLIALSVAIGIALAYFLGSSKKEP